MAGTGKLRPGDKDVKLTHKGGFMINTNYSTASLLSQVYADNQTALSTSLNRISTGKRVITASDDFISFIRSQTATTQLSNYQTVKQNLVDAKGLVDYGKTVGDTIVADMKKLKDIFTSYTNAAAADKDSWSSQYSATYQKMTNTIAQSKYNGTTVYANNAVLVTVNLDPSSGTAGSFAVNVNNPADPSNQANLPDFGVNLSNIGNVVSTNIDNAITGAMNYVSLMTGFSSQAAQYIKLTDSIISAKTAYISQLVDVNEADEMAQVTNLQIRQQATASMMAQANNSNAAIARIYS
jgi:flagellin